jgi:hypothetical protein
VKRLALIFAMFIGLVATLGLSEVTTTSSTSQGRIHFTTVDVFVDPQGQPLAAYQLEFVADEKTVKLVGIEGGEHPAFSNPPYYDPAALSNHRVILAALNAGDDLPKAKTRVARLHLQIEGEHPTWSAQLIVAASRDEKKISAIVQLSEGAKL